MFILNMSILNRRNFLCPLALAITMTSTLPALVMTSPSKTAANQTLQGYLVDNACSMEKHKSADWAAKHSKSCLNMEECQKSGYAILTPDQKLYKFDAKGNAEARKLIDATEKKDNWKITLKGAVDRQNKTVAVSSIALQP